MKKINKKQFAILLCSLFVVAALFTFNTVQKTGAYFSDSVNNSGQGTVILKHSTVTHENIEDGKDKVITVENTGTTDVIVKILLEYPDGVATVGPKEGDALVDWVRNDDGWYYYTKVLKAGETSSAIKVTVGENAPTYEFDITVMTASERVVYNEDGSLFTPDGWAYVPQGGDQ